MDDRFRNFLESPASKPMSGLSQPSSPEQPPPAADEESQRVAMLVVRARAGDRSAYGQIVLLYQDRLYNALLRMVGETEEARELTQETFARGLENLSTFRGDSGAYTWLFRIGMNLAITQLRRSQRRRTFSLDAGGGGNGQHRIGGDSQAAGLVDRIASAEAQPHQVLEKREQAQIVLDALGRLDPEYRAVLVMRDIESMDYRRMADVLEMPLGTLKSRLFRARLALRDELASYMSTGKRKQQ
jgi:RNA polymerase sigma-70 factor, ECF subfamily